MIVVAVVDADNDAHGKYLLSFQIFRKSIINGGGEYVSLAEIFLRKLPRFCLSRLAIGSQNRTASGEIHATTKKRILLFGRMRVKSLVDIFRQMG